MRYHRELQKGLPTFCPCTQKLTLTHALNCKRGGFVHMRHMIILISKTSLQDFSKSCNMMFIVQTEPPLQPITEAQSDELRNTADAARFDIVGRKAFGELAKTPIFYVRITNPLSSTLHCLYSMIVMKKKRNDRTILVIVIQHSLLHCNVSYT